MKRIFIVGIARSGTTLLQSMLGKHQEIYTFPESHLFSKTIPKESILRIVHRINSDHMDMVKEFMFEVGKGHVFNPFHRSRFNLNHWAKYLIECLDNLCLAEGEKIWLEKTPLHLYYIDLIKKNCTNCQFIHTIREPIANIASLYDVSRKYPDFFAQNTIEKAIKRYKKEIKISERYLGHPDHFHLHYEDLVDDSSTQIRSICNFINVSFSDSLLDYQDTVDAITQKNELWKEGNKKIIAIQDKIKQRLDEGEYDKVVAELSKFKSNLLKRYEQD